MTAVEADIAADAADLSALGLPVRDYERVAEALRHLAQNWEHQPDLERVAAASGLSPFHFQRVFTRWVGLSPKQFLKKLTIEEAKRRLADSASVLDASYDSGLSGPGRLHDLFVSCEAMTPGEFKAMGRGFVIRWGFVPSPFGEALVMTSPRGLCGLGFLDDRGHDGVLADLVGRFPGADLRRDDAEAARTVSLIFAAGDERGRPDGAPLKLFLRGTRFQIQVWDALMRLPPGALTTYGDLARRLDMPSGAARAVGTAVGANPISWLIPCHRVIRRSGALGGYRWGLPRKLAMLGWEASAQPDSRGA